MLRLPAALGGNLGGSTSALLALDGGAFAGRTRLDIIFPVAEFKRCADYDNGYGAYLCCTRLESVFYSLQGVYPRLYT